MTNLLQFTLSVQKPHRQPQNAFQIACEDRVLFIVSLCGKDEMINGFKYWLANRQLCLTVLALTCVKGLKETKKNLCQNIK
jgi:hypothetical protein